MIARMWRGATGAEDSQAYAEYMGGSGGKTLADTPGNRGVYMLRRIEGDTAEFVMLSLWDSEDAIHAFAGDDISVAVFFPDDDRYLTDRELTVSHYEVVEIRGLG
ncbi:MAG: antibiotic biosynthesis monooxygenase [Actinomycetota bacterium]